jgi:hypothetical protein
MPEYCIAIKVFPQYEFATMRENSYNTVLRTEQVKKYRIISSMFKKLRKNIGRKFTSILTVVMR